MSGRCRHEGRKRLACVAPSVRLLLALHVRIRLDLLDASPPLAFSLFGCEAIRDRPLLLEFAKSKLSLNHLLRNLAGTRSRRANRAGSDSLRACCFELAAQMDDLRLCQLIASAISAAV
jgi:hypothetical protein